MHPGEGKTRRKHALKRILLGPDLPARKDRPVKFAISPINSPRDAADIAVAVAKAVAAGEITPNEASEIAKVIDAYVRAYQTAELDERAASITQLSDAELMRIIARGHQMDVTPALPKSLIFNSR